MFVLFRFLLVCFGSLEVGVEWDLGRRVTRTSEYKRRKDKGGGDGGGFCVLLNE